MSSLETRIKKLEEQKTDKVILIATQTDDGKIQWNGATYEDMSTLDKALEGIDGTVILLSYDNHKTDSSEGHY